MFAPLQIVLAAVVLVIWVYLLFGRGQFWRVYLRQREVPQNIRIAAIVPARNEAAVIARSVKSLLGQHAVEMQVFVVDDNSSDHTADIAKSAAANSSRLTVIHGQPLPPGWTGKLWAVRQGIEAAKSTTPDFLLLTDADIEHAPESIASLAATAEAGNFDLASYMVRLQCETLPEKLLIPAFVFFFFKLYPPQWIADPRRATAGAAGGCILVRPEALHRAGGIERIRSEIIDDCALAREVKRTGGRVWLGLTNSAASIRPYCTFAEIGRMISRSAFYQLRHSFLLLFFAIIGLILTYMVPLVLLFSPSPIAALCGAIAFTLMMTAYAPMVRFYRLNPLWALTLPLAAVFYLGATIHSAVRYWLGRGGEWKGRTQDSLGATHAG